MGCGRKICLDLPLLAGCVALMILQVAYLGLLPSYPSAMSMFVVQPGVAVGLRIYVATIWSLILTTIGLYGTITSNRQLVWWVSTDTDESQVWFGPKTLQSLT